MKFTRKAIEKLCYAKAAFIVLLITAGCSFQNNKTSGSNPGVGAESIGSFAAVSSEIFQPKCVRCHSASNASGGVDLSSYQAIQSNPGLAVASQPDNSRIYTEVHSGSMPEGGPPLSAAEVKAIKDWILAGAPNGTFPESKPDPADSNSATAPPTPPTTTPVTIPSTDPTTVPTITSATFTEVQNKILTKACIRCHSGGQPAGHVDLMGYKTIFSGTKQVVVPNQPSQSLLFTEIESGSMPPRGPKISKQLVQLMKDWIEQGAKND